MNNLYVVESPLQALCALEVSLGKAEENHSIIVKLSSKSRVRNNTQIMNIVNLREWNDKSIIRMQNYKFSVLNHLFLRSKLLNIQKKFKNNIDSLYIGEFRYAFMHMVRCAVNAPNVYLLDDGAATVNIINNYILKQIYSPTIVEMFPFNPLKSNIFKIIYGQFLSHQILKKRIKVITAFSETKDLLGITKLEFRHIKSLIPSEKEEDVSLVYFYGSKYSEAGILSRESEINLLGKIKKFYANYNKEVIYFPHRDESEEKLSIISNKLGFKVRYSDEIAEVYLLNSPILPSEIAGFYTSTLNNLKAIYPDLTTRSFRMRSSDIKTEFRSVIELVYEHYKNIGISLESDYLSL